MNFLKFTPLTFSEKLKDKRILFGIIFFVIFTIAVISFFDIVLAVGIIFIGFLTLITFLIISKTKIKSKALYAILSIALLIHSGAVLFIYYAHFQPFSGGEGDYTGYNLIAQQIATRIHLGNFSLQGLESGYHYPVVIGYIYALTTPEMLIGQLFAVWLAVISVLLVYLIVLEIGGTVKRALLIGLITVIYPSYLLYGSLLLKDTLIIPLVLVGLLLTLKLIKNFFWINFLFFYIVLAAVTHFRFYVGYALIVTFVISWFLFSKTYFKKRIVYGIMFLVLLGFIPQIAANQGYYGINSAKTYLNSEMLNFYRQVAYNPVSFDTNPSPTPTSPTPTSPTPTSPTPTSPTPTSPTPTSDSPSSIPGLDSSFQTGSGPLGYVKSFIYVSFGPFPWQIKNLRQLFTIVETIPWYFLLFFIIKGALVALKRERIALPLLVFSMILFGILALFITNFGIITRIRIPGFIALLCLIPLGFKNI